jgi:hypothetical protein
LNFEALGPFFFSILSSQPDLICVDNFGYDLFFGDSQI